ncbi:MAG: family 43 glycosylhydrolase [Singulisphaera sp.]
MTGRPMASRAWRASRSSTRARPSRLNSGDRPWERAGRRGRRLDEPPAGRRPGRPVRAAASGRFYLYGTNDGPPPADGRAIPVHRSDDLIHWEPLGGALEPTEPEADHWAPEVMYWNGRFFMVVSFGDVDRRGHALWVAMRPTARRGRSGSRGA